MIEKGAESVIAICTHALLSGDAYEKIEKSKVYAIVVIEDDKPIGLLRMHDVLRSGIK